MDWLYDRVATWAIVVLSLTVHEWAHAWMAGRLGDDTARLLGRTTLQPFAHLDAVGTVILPLLGVPFGWAKPVPVEPLRFRPEVSMAGGLLQTALAGPVSNLCLAAVCAVLLRLAGEHLGGAGHALLDRAVLVNIALAVLNLLPIPPLDGSRVVDGLLPRALRPAWDAFGSVAPGLLVVGIAVVWWVGSSLVSLWSALP